MTVIKQEDLIQSVADSLQYISYYHPMDYITSLGRAYELEQSPAAKESATIGGKEITIAYSSPRVRGREGKIFTKDGLIGGDRTYPVWRAGANNATALQTAGTLVFDGITVPPGSYTVFVNIADPNNWELIINKQTGQWGLTYDQGQDVGRAKMTMSKPAARRT